MENKNETRVDRMLAYLKNNKLSSIVIFSSICLIAIATLIASVKSLHDNLFGQGEITFEKQNHVPITNAEAKKHSHELQDSLEQKIENRIKGLDYAIQQTYDGYVMNYVWSCSENRIASEVPYYGHQGAPEDIIPQNEALLNTELQKQGVESIYGDINSFLPKGYSIDWIYLRIIFDYQGQFKLLQGIEGNVIGPDGRDRPLDRVLSAGK